MHAHHEKKLAFFLHPKAASRAIRIVLEDRGFVLEGDHHGDGDAEGYHKTCVVRNHFDTLLSWRCVHTKWREAPDNVVHLNFAKEWPFNDKFWFPKNGTLWPFIWIYEDIEILRYENLREELDDYLVRNGFDPLEDNEFRVVPVHQSPGKPEHWQDNWDEDARKYIERRYSKELKRLKYKF